MWQQRNGGNIIKYENENVCFSCKKLRHIAHACHKWKNNEMEKVNNVRLNEEGNDYVFTTNNASNNVFAIDWIIDSSAIQHMTLHKKCFTS